MVTGVVTCSSDVVEVVHIADKGRLLDTIEIFCIYFETQKLNDSSCYKA
jgi:hypothetical protein